MLLEQRLDRSINAFSATDTPCQGHLGLIKPLAKEVAKRRESLFAKLSVISAIQNVLFPDKTHHRG